MAKMGRPKVDNPMERRITIRFTKEEYQKLDDFATRGCMTKSEVLKKGLESSSCKPLSTILQHDHIVVTTI